MANNLKQRIMNAINSDKDLFTVNGSWQTTEIIKKAMNDSDWEEISGKTEYAITSRKPRFRVDFNEHYDAMSRMKANAPVAGLVPSNTRFSFVKKIMVRMMRVSTGFQQDFNFAACDATDKLLAYAVEVSKRAEKQSEIIEKQGRLIDALLKEQERLHSIIDEQRTES